MIGHMVIAIALSGFNDLGCLVTWPIFFMMDHFLYRFKNLRKSIYWNFEFCAKYVTKFNVILLALHLSVRQFQMPPKSKINKFFIPEIQGLEIIVIIMGTRQLYIIHIFIS